ncbi:E3 ubiquitin/ISG15 ligase TRIM25-like [Engraulis encrasicolus]|uniref:E3 ubiquitin/ISG15 ligase TRIM25-like n=1 Tax=Engraulis encrasicolus TaxID=184585 RepID=UPI002FD04D25
MAEAFPEDDNSFQCSVCLDPLKDPVTLSCGHSYCMSCISGCWDQQEMKGEYSCPQCRETFPSRPALKRNIMLAELVEKLSQTDIQVARPATPYAGPGDLKCDFCSEGPLKAVKSCLVCQISLCGTHVQPHYDIPALKTHKLVKATQLQKLICSLHGNALQVFCRTDQKCICILCTMDDHKGHDTVSVAAERKEREDQLEDTKKQFRQRLKQRRKELQELQEAMKDHKVH